MNHYLITYNRKSGQIEDLQEFGDSERAEALQARFALERLNRARTEVEVVLLGAPSLDTLKLTHSRYFKTPDELAAAL